MGVKERKVRTETFFTYNWEKLVLERKRRRTKKKLGEELGRENPTVFAVEFAEIR